MTVSYDTFHGHGAYILRCDHPQCVALRSCGPYWLESMHNLIDAYTAGWRRHWRGNQPRDYCPTHATPDNEGAIR